MLHLGQRRSALKVGARSVGSVSFPSSDDDLDERSNSLYVALQHLHSASSALGVMAHKCVVEPESRIYD
jgi:hypothetical protein